MEKRTVKIMGYALEPGVTMHMRFDDIDVFSGIVPESTSEVEIGSFQVDQTMDGNKNGFISVSGGAMTFIGLSADHSALIGSGKTFDDGTVIPPTTQSDVDAFVYLDNGSNQSKTDMVLNFDAITLHDVDAFTGNWHISLTDGDSFSCVFPLKATPTAPDIRVD